MHLDSTRLFFDDAFEPFLQSARRILLSHVGHGLGSQVADGGRWDLGHQAADAAIVEKNSIATAQLGCIQGFIAAANQLADLVIAINVRHTAAECYWNNSVLVPKLRATRRRCADDPGNRRLPPEASCTKWRIPLHHSATQTASRNSLRIVSETFFSTVSPV